MSNEYLLIFSLLGVNLEGNIVSNIVLNLPILNVKFDDKFTFDYTNTCYRSILYSSKSYFIMGIKEEIFSELVSARVTENGHQG